MKRPARRIGFQFFALVLVATVWLQDRPAHAPPIPASEKSPASLSVDANTRLLLVAPHPDDEMLAAGGLLQLVNAAGGIVHVVYLTDGEGYPQGVRAERHATKLTAADYRAYGHQREDEARTAMRSLGFGGWSLTFLGFPNGGLNRLMTTHYWSSHRHAYRSQYTRLDRPAPSEAFDPGTEYRGEDLMHELADIIRDFKPTMILVSRPEDQHVDHCAAWFFVADALANVQRVSPLYHPDVVTYIIHYGSWPFDQPGMHLPAPEYLDGGVSGWVMVPLDAHQLDLKRAALHAYKSQMDVMDWFLDGFVRTNEVFSWAAPPRIVLPVEQNDCDEFIDQ